VRYEKTERFLRDFKRLSDREQEMFRSVVPDFSTACDAWARDPSTRFPDALRVKPMRGTVNIWEMTWSFSGPDGRATFSWVALDDGLQAVRWRRIGDHTIYADP
jgi:hypothetical protein